MEAYRVLERSALYIDEGNRGRKSPARKIVRGATEAPDISDFIDARGARDVFLVRRRGS